MSANRFPYRSLVASVAVASLLLCTPSQATAGLVSTSQALEIEAQSDARTTVAAYLARADIAAQLERLGVEPELARSRVAAMTESEIQELAGRIEQAPAGGDGVFTVLGITFLVLLVLELVGVIDIFKKI